MTATMERQVAGTATPGDLMSAGARARLVLVLGSLIAIGPLTIDMYLPALPSLTAEFATTAAAVQLTLTGTLAGLAAGQLVIGPLSDVVGRRIPLLAGTAVHVLASILCVFAPNIAVLGGLRVLQGLGAAAAAVVAMAVVRDLFTGLPAARILSRLMLVMGAAPVLAPTLGSALLSRTDWRGVFAALAVFGVLLIVMTALALPETLPRERRRPATPGSVLRAYAGLLRDRVYVGLALVTGLMMAAIFGYVAGSSFVMQGEFGLSEQEFGVAFGGGAAGMIIATQLNVRLLRRWTPSQILVSALLGGLAAAVALVVFAVADVGGLAGVLVPLWLVLAAAGLAFPNAPALALSRHGEAAGTAAALLGAGQFGIGALAAPAVGVLGSNATAMAAVIAGSLAAATLVLFTLARPWRLAEPSGTDAVVAVH
ncbi:multidrug effflux MFS transporter [Catenuloplanes atrovinosus]|uniref:DHA1 family bicyclomycin/chloramphenicol resistance-like MFS transporter n=1 Tax=Catenuloplanes atrovinosus TaxID=137266 RepID=A0AAE3YLZ9_9ACTN|nr:multidrug effflux MFS transporter [Catenuloplanes atrovinosus]MDR7275467.1 DHA1 family bicyclomycin/chloramphenicol resistance-like MFS transporter [Catenuloplanes atrovinosus]